MKTIRITISIVLLFFSVNAFSTIILVPTTYTSIQAALNAASLGDTVLVSPGIYYENIIWPQIQGIKLLSAGDSANTFIDANHIGRPITFTGQVSLDTTTIIKGFTIRNGNVSSSPAFGGGIYLKNSSIILLNLHICNNNLTHLSDSVFGGGIFCINSSPLIFNTSIDHNSISGSRACGGGIACYKSSPVIKFCLVNFNKIHSDTWSYGGGIYLDDESNPLIIQCEINYNFLGDNASWVCGGGFYAANQSSPVIKNVIVKSNGMGNHAGWYYGGGIFIQVCKNVILENLVIDSNYTGNGVGNGWNSGAGIYFEKNFISPDTIRSKIMLTNVKIINNILGDSCSHYFGGGISVTQCDTIIGINLLITNNILGVGEFNWFGGAGLYIEDTSNLFLINSTIANNIRADSGAVDGSGLYTVNGSVSVLNCIFWDPNTLHEIWDNDSIFTANYSNIRGGYSGLFNINIDPSFIGNGNYHLQSNSLCIGSGNLAGAPTFDIDNDPRPLPIGTNPDLGAYEDTAFYARLCNYQITNSLKIFPNPVHEKIIVVYSEKENAKLTIYNLIGELVLQGELDKPQNEIDISILTTGLYIIKVTGSDWTEQKKMMKE
jgi:hypothetical protein